MRRGSGTAAPRRRAASQEVLRWLLPSALLALIAATARAEAIATAEYAAPVDRYGHFALGRPHEYARLTATTNNGRSYMLTLPDDEVFEDLAPRLVSLTPGEPHEILSIISQRDSGARLALIRLRADHLEISAQSPPIGTPMRWLNPVGIAEFDNDGQAEVAAVITPHLNGTLKIYRRSGDRLVEITSLSGVSNHVHGSAELALSTPALIAGQMQLLVPDTARHRLRIIALRGARLAETAHCQLAAPLTGALRMVSASEISVGLPSGRQLISLKDCPTSQGAGGAAPG